jgi:hypothetical protein
MRLSSCSSGYLRQQLLHEGWQQSWESQPQVGWQTGSGQHFGSHTGCGQHFGSQTGAGQHFGSGAQHFGSGVGQHFNWGAVQQPELQCEPDFDSPRNCARDGRDWPKATLADSTVSVRTDARNANSISLPLMDGDLARPRAHARH